MIAGISDSLDGLLARRLHCTSRLGAILDPIADKALILSSFTVMYSLKQIPFGLLMIVLLKDFIIGLGIFTLSTLGISIEFKPTFISKLNTCCQLALIAFALFELAYFNILPEPWFDIAMMMVVVLNLLTIISYVLLTWRKYLVSAWQ